MQQVQLATFGIWELVLILAIVLVIFGAGKLPMLGESLGKGIRNFRKSFKDDPKQVEGEARRIEQAPNAGQLSASAPAEPAAAERKQVESKVDDS
jgi:sec-independent protein translocase protein TatA